ncbi:MAG: adenosine kinase [Acidiferrobacterales bacterium]|nr:adenosine kinase [Acidiferrobacterales bacterium]
MSDRVDVLGIGNAIVDILCPAQDSDLQELGLDKGMMTLVDGETVGQLKQAVAVDSMQSGGSVANSVAQLSALGGRGQFIGKVADDHVGDKFRQEMIDLSIRFETSPMESQISTGCCYIFVTPDAQRTMCTHLGASGLLTTDDLDPAAVSLASVVLIEGYLWDLPDSVELIHETVRVAKHSQTLVALSLSDPLLVNRHRDRLQDFIHNHVDIVFANELEWKNLCESEREELGRTTNRIAEHTVITRGEQGSVVTLKGTTCTRPADPVSEVVDTTGAGDAYAAGYLYGLTRNWSVERCMELASKTAAQTIAHMGARLGSSI